MKNIWIILFPILIACSNERSEVVSTGVEEKIKQNTKSLAEAEANDNLDVLMEYYNIGALSMPEYQLTLDGQEEIKLYFTEILKRQNVKSYVHEAEEFIHMDKTIVAIGTFKKEYSNDSNPDSVITLHGKYWHVWEAYPDNNFKLVGESFGYLHPVSYPEALTVHLNKTQPDESDVLLQKEIPFELKAYNALMEKGVRTRDGVLRSSFFTNDGRFFPYAEPVVSGIEKIKPYLIGYSSRGQVTIDSIMCYTYDYKYSGKYVIEYDLFKVKWTTASGSGRTEGKGIRIWQRQEDGSLRLFREIGTHNLL